MAPSRSVLMPSMWCFAAALGLSTSDAKAAPPDGKACAAAYEKAQVARKRGDLVGSKGQLEICATATCPEFIQKDCSRWFQEVSADVPTVSVRAVDGDEQDVPDVGIKVDGKPLPQEQLGRSFAINPGPHLLEVQARDGRRAERNVVVQQGVKNRAIQVKLPPAKPTKKTPPPVKSPAKSPEAGTPIPTLAWVLGGVGLAGLGAFAILGVTGNGRLSDLETSCAPRCDPSEVDSVQTHLLMADLALVLGVGALGAATYITLTAPPPPAPASGDARLFPPQPGGPRLPTQLVVGGRF